ncbi:Uncharacterized membrane protein YgcG, contains a TPM-fold domain [Acetitomaculum ruminis DSM 5522]|uniref:Uncharacterized membrane protein YgcG, contains a TPM-fold domain n=1 Tax=Acetitomaculum ruminis DSM 5522 TaxID=1120918 RepID=A0A1I1AC87_9FIRM|nr:TPM domain-containing protein [Acetitomaculum ruminis]SFB33973.1 Uncharacterized membrane protein YgcG, contains a TPM-fold domain [Acetitomaculum ruminis DSM 5522]
MKKIIIFFSLLVFVFSSAFTYVEEKQRVFDNSDTLISNELNSLEKKCQKYSFIYEGDFVILIDSEYEKNRAKDFYNNGFFGYTQSGHDGIILYISIDKKKVEIKRFGSFLNLSHKKIKVIIKTVQKSLKEEDYLGACKSFLKTTVYFLENKDADAGDYEKSIAMNRNLKIFISGMFIYLLVMTVAMIIILKKHKRK